MPWTDRPYHIMPPADYKLFLAAMREDRCVEYPLVGWDAVGAWLVKMQFVAKRPATETLQKYRKLFGMPVSRTARQSRHHKTSALPWTTNLMLQAWIGTQGRALGLPRWHPFRVSVESQYSQKPRAIRQRQYDYRKRLANRLAARALGEARLRPRQPKPVTPTPMPVAATTEATPLRFRRLIPAK